MEACRFSTLRKDPATDGFVVQFAKPALDQVEPTGTGRDKVEHEAGMALQPRSHVRMLMSAVIIHDQMEGNLTGELLVEGAQELEELLMPMPLLALTDHLSLQRLQSGEQGGDAVALVVVGHRPTTPIFNGQAGLGPIQRLDLALLVHAQHDRFLRRIQVQPDHVGHFL